MTLIEAGTFRNCLVSPRSAKEYGVPTNGASNGETPQSLDMEAGDIPRQDMLQRLDTGVYVDCCHSSFGLVTMIGVSRRA